MKSRIILVVITLFIFLGCKKSSNTTGGTNTDRVGSIYSDSSRITTTYFYSPTFLVRGSYDDSGRYNFGYHYYNGESVEEVSVNYIPAYTNLFFWNTSGLADSSVLVNTNGTTGSRKKYTYDGNGFLTNVKWFNHINTIVLTEDYVISGNNVIQHTYNIIDSTDHSLPSGTNTFEYYTDKTNTLSNEYYGMPYLGISSKNAVKSWAYTNGSNTSKVNYEYRYESGRIVSQIIYADSAGLNGARIDSLHFGYYVQ